jgi:serine/threonine-protein kinase
MHCASNEDAKMRTRPLASTIRLRTARIRGLLENRGGAGRGALARPSDGWLTGPKLAPWLARPEVPMKDPHLQQVLGPYRLDRVVGRGGMGTVYAATELGRGEVCAVKLLAPALTGDPAFRERFSAEIESLKKLRHPNIVQLYGYGEQDGQLYYSMELIAGSSLQDELRHGRRFSWRDVVNIAVDVCGALKHAHDHGIVHRDLKPANLLYTADEKVKLLDFGIAKLFGNPGLTTGSVMGTADYMAPEQAEGKAVGPRTDLYSLGSVMYALLTGRPPFVGKSLPEVVHKVRFESPIPVSRIAADVPVELDHLIEQLLEKNPQKRVPTALATAHRLKAMEHALSVRHEPSDDLPASDVSQRNGGGDRARAIDPNLQETVRLDPRQDEAGAVQQLTVTTRDAPSPAGTDHFVAVETADEKAQSERFPWQAIPLALALIAIVWGSYQAVRWASQPASADELYARIHTHLEDESAAPPNAVEREMIQFLEHYRDDPRAAEIERRYGRLELSRLQRRMEEKAWRPSRAAGPPVEQMYLEISRLVPTQPELAVRRLQAFIALLSTQEAELDDEQRRFLRLARFQLEQLQQRAEQQQEMQSQLLEQHLATARHLAADNPQQARRLYESLIELFGDKPWAADTIAAARRELAELPAAPGGERPASSAPHR